MQKLPFIIQIRILIAIYLKSVFSQYETHKNIGFLKLIIFVISCTKTVALGLIRIQITKNCDKSTFKDIKQEKVFK